MNVSQLIENRITELGDWRGKRMAQLRKLIRDASPELVEEWKWDTPVWSSNGNVVAIGAFKDHIKLNFFRGATLDDPHHLFNSGLEAKTSRTIDLSESDQIDEAALRELVRSAVAANHVKSKPAKPKAKAAPTKKASASRKK